VITEATTEPGDEVARLRAERDELRAEIDRVGARTRRRHGARQAAAGTLVVLACLSFLTAMPGVWANRTFLHSDHFVERAGPLVDDPAVQEALTIRLTEQLMVLIEPGALFEEAVPERGQILSAPLANAVEGFVLGRVERFLASDSFEQLWTAAIRVAHEAAVRALRDESDVVTARAADQVSLNLIPVIDAVLADIISQAPEVLGRDVRLPEVSVEDIPAAAIGRIERALGVDLDEDFGQVTVYEEGRLAAAQQGVETFDRLVPLLLPLAVLAALGALWTSTRRRITLLQLTVGVALAAVLVRRVAFALEGDIAALPPTEQGQRAAAVVLDSFVAPLTTFAAWTLLVTAAVAGVALLNGPYPWAASLRRRIVAVASGVTSAAADGARDEPTRVWVRQHHDALLVGVAVIALLVLWVADLSWVGLVVLLVVTAACAAAAHRIGASTDTPGTGSTSVSDA
jgi:hypothetical protein